jgi:hypothetical protein
MAPLAQLDEPVTGEGASHRVSVFHRPRPSFGTDGVTPQVGGRLIEIAVVGDDHAVGCRGRVPVDLAPPQVDDDLGAGPLQGISVSGATAGSHPEHVAG